MWFLYFIFLLCGHNIQAQYKRSQSSRIVKKKHHLQTNNGTSEHEGNKI